MQTLNEAKIKAALRETGETEDKLDALISLAIDEEKLNFEDTHAKKVRHF